MNATWIMLLAIASAPAAERVLTRSATGHLIHNSQIFSKDGKYIVFDSRNDDTQLASSTIIGLVEIETGRESVLHESPRSSRHGPGVGAASFSPVSNEVVFIHGLDNASVATPYAPQRRSAALVSLDAPTQIQRLDARDVTPPFTPGASRGGTHAHHWSGDGEWLSFTYNDAVVFAPGPAPADLRTIGVIQRDRPVSVHVERPGDEFSGVGYTVVVVPVTSQPEPGKLSRAFEEGWVGMSGYLRTDGSRQKRALAFIGNTVTKSGQPLSEIFIADLPEELGSGAEGPLEGTSEHMPYSPKGVVVRRLTHTESTPRPGLQGPRHWVRASPDGKIIAFLDQDEQGIVQLFGVSPNGGETKQLSRLSRSIDAPFSWSPCGRYLATSAGGRIVRVRLVDGETETLTPTSEPGCEPRYGVVHSPDGRQLAFNRMLPHPDGGSYLQICLLDLPTT